jgi:hypothetical protein
VAPKRSDQRRGGSVRVGTGRETNLVRRFGTREQRWSVLIVTNGQCTERRYFEELRKEPWVRADKIVVICKKGSPEDVVKAAHLRWDRDQFETCWVVCDVDEFDVDAASELAEGHGIGLLWSNPCFEVWLVLHLEHCKRHFENAKQVQARLKKLLPAWDKTRLDFADFREGVLRAADHAQRLDDAPAANPSTAVWQVIEHLQQPG